MSVQLNDITMLSEIKTAFSEQFPFLKVEFSIINGDTLKEAKDDTCLGAYRLNNVNALQVLPTTTIKEFKTWFQEVFNLSVKVYRKSGNSWLTTTITDNWNLNQQNKYGEEVTLSIYQKEKY